MLVGTYFHALFKTFLVHSDVSIWASASQSSTERGITSTVRERRMRASVVDSLRSTVSFHSQAELGISSAVYDVNDEVERTRGKEHTFTQDTFLRFYILFKVGCFKPCFDALTNVLNSVSKDDLGIITILEWR
jgi:hypothetical protein